MLMPSTLDSYVGRPISQVCPHGYDSGSQNHCAHFVAHALQLRFGYTCTNGRAQVGSANVRVQELFPQCSGRREILECPTSGEGLIFVSNKINFHPGHIDNVPKKHVGIMLNGRVWHYSNSGQKVVVQPVGEFLFHYPRQNNALWFGSLPPQSRPTSFGTCS